MMKSSLLIMGLLCGSVALAGPARPIRSANFLPQTPCGPAWDTFAREGQWFLDPAAGVTDVNSWEYHDDKDPLTIKGTVVSIAYANPGITNSNIIAFDIEVVVSNSLPAEYVGGSASNSHMEAQAPPMVYYQDGMMIESRIVAEFALADASMPPPPGAAPPYWLDPVSAGAYYIEAVNEDEWAWYCWSPNAPDDQQFQPPGNFQVPTWRLTPFDIPPGQQASALMSFVVTGAGMPVYDYRHSVIRASQQLGLDVLYNRHTSLKISHWVDTLLIDGGSFITAPPGQYEPEPPEYIYASDCSVFFNSAHSGEKAKLTLTAVATNQSPDEVVLDWTAIDVIDYQVQYCNDLLSNNWTTATNSPGRPGLVPSAMQWADDGTVITNLPIQQQPHRFYRLVEP